jgi:hypothetical protein
MTDERTCGQGLAERSLLHTRIGALLGAMAEVLDVHTTALDTTDQRAAAERDAYRRLVAEHRELAARLKALGDEMAGYRALPMGRHDWQVLASPPAVDALERLTRREDEALGLLQQHLSEDQGFLGQMRAPDTGQAPG